MRYTDRSVNDVISLAEKREMVRDAHMISDNTSAFVRRQEVDTVISSPNRYIRSPPGLQEPCTANGEQKTLLSSMRTAFSPLLRRTEGREYQAPCPL